MVRITSPSFVPNIPPIEKGYHWGKYQIPQVQWDKYDLQNYGVNAVYFCNDPDTASELVANQIKQNIAFEEAFFYIYPLTPSFSYDVLNFNRGRQETRIYMLIQLGKFRAYDAYDKMLLNVDSLSVLLKLQNPAILNIKINSSEFLRLAKDDNSFTAQMSTLVSSTGIRRMPFKICT
jgi:hypothetical protein